ncbi:MAG: C-terminal binding protein [Acetobacteraceae bacterium]|jgi:phosphoglycerate dehydrogenase-like enzyme|nr:C-terminal binding protein [Acetobacteraceae bacterium]
MSGPRILFPGFPFPPEGDDLERAVFGPDAVLDYARVDSPEEIADDRWRAADAVMLFRFRLPASRIAMLDRCRIVVRYGVGVDRVDRIALASRGIPLCNTPDYGTTEVADHALALILSLRRGIAAYDAALRHDLAGHWTYQAVGGLRRMGVQKAAVIGLGRIGTAVALRLKAFGVSVTFHDPYLPQGVDRALGLARAETLEEALDGADLLTIHAPLTRRTKGLIGAAALARLASGAVVVNTARGEILDLDALAASLRTGHVHAAGLDVLPEEPPDPSHPLIAAWRTGEPWLAGRLLITPHAAFHSPEAQADMRRKAAETAALYLREGRLRNVYPPDAM